MSNCPVGRGCLNSKLVSAKAGIERGEKMKVGRRKYAGEVPKISHGELVNRAFQYLKYSIGCSVVFKERVGSSSENPDAIGFRGGFSYLIECKASRADFLVDKKKGFRLRPRDGMGYERYFMAPEGLLEPSEIPSGWGLLEVGEVARKYRPVTIARDSGIFYERNLQAEVAYLASAIRRINISMAVFVEPLQPPGGKGK